MFGVFLVYNLFLHASAVLVVSGVAMVFVGIGLEMRAKHLKHRGMAKAKAKKE